MTNALATPANPEAISIRTDHVPAAMMVIGSKRDAGPQLEDMHFGGTAVNAAHVSVGNRPPPTATGKGR
jgi:hypothetical protein